MYSVQFLRGALYYFTLLYDGKKLCLKSDAYYITLRNIVTCPSSICVSENFSVIYIFVLCFYEINDSCMNKLWHEYFMHENVIFKQEDFIFMHENKDIAQKLSWVKVTCTKLCTVQLTHENHVRGKIVIFMHVNIIFIHESFIFMRGNVNCAWHDFFMHETFCTCVTTAYVIITVYVTLPPKNEQRRIDTLNSLICPYLHL